MLFFSGEFEHAIDAKLRLAIPAEFRAQWKPAEDGTAWFCVPWPNGSLRLYTEAAFLKMASQLSEPLMPDEATAEREARFFSFARRLEIDAQGRITLPRKHVELVGLPSEVVLIGARNRLEVRDRARWRADEQARFHGLAVGPGTPGPGGSPGMKS